MRVGSSLSRQQAAFALIIGRRFAGAFVAAPRCDGLAPSPTVSSEARSFRAEMVMQPSNSRRWLHALPASHRHSPRAALTLTPSPAAAALNASVKRWRPTSGRPLMIAEAALTRIKAGEQFGDVAVGMSSCPSKEKGGDLGWFKKGQMVAEFEAACFENDPGTIVKVQSQFGWHVVALLSKAVLPRQVGVEELGEILELVKNEAGGAESKYQFVDVREEEELGKAKLDGFINLPLSKFEEWSDKLTGEGAILDAEKDVVVMCHHGMRSNQMAQHLATKVGFKRVWNVEGGIDAYAKQVDSSVGVY
eukprot:jgi/Undpi1/9915/HiC_scaffold_28.g12369.m1